MSPTQRLVRRTQEAYVRAVRQLAEHYHKSPDLITEEELRQYFLYIKNLKHYSRKTSTIAICGIKFFLKRRSAETGPLSGYCARPAKRRLPVILSPEEVRKILGCLRLPRYKVCLTSIYSCGLRLQEGINLRVADIDSARRMIYVPHGKGAKIVTSRCRNAFWRCCASTGPRIAIRCCSFLHPATASCPWLLQLNRYTRAACKTLSTRR